MSNESIACPCCFTEYDTFPEFLDHAQATINLAASSLPIIEGHNHGVCECPSCEALRRLYPPNAAVPTLFEDDDDDDDDHTRPRNL